MAVGDYDNDGDLDLYVNNYGPNVLYRNNGDGTFTDVTKACGLYKPNNRSMSAVALDLDADGDVDIFSTNDAMPNSYFRNNGQGKFTEEAEILGVAFGEGGQGASSMGPVVGDVDRNGLYDIFVPDMGYNCMLFQTQKDFFEDVTNQSKLAVICGQYTGWGGGLIDYDNDGYLDVFVANGNAHHLYTEEDVLAHFDGKRRFKDVARDSGEYFHRKYVGRGASFGDYDNDGDIDILVLNLNDTACLLRNDGGNKRNWLKVVPKRKKTGLVAIGSQVTVTVGSLKMIQPVIAVNGYLASNDPRPNFGLGAAKKADLVEIRWPDGQIKTLKNVRSNQILEVLPGAK